MALIESPSNPSQVQLEIERLFKAARVVQRPLDYMSQDGARVGGHYRAAFRSGAITGAGVVAGAPLFSFNWRDPDYVFLLTFLEAYLVPTVVFTAAQELGLDAIMASAFTAADTAGTAIVPTGIPRARRTMNQSRITAMQIAIATLLTAGTRTLDVGAVAVGSGVVNVVNAAAGTAYVNPGGGGKTAFGFCYEPDVARGEHPITLGRDEGLVIRNLVGFPAAGAATLVVNMGWAELPAY